MKWDEEKAIQEIYKSYMAALPYQIYEEPDQVKRHPEFTKEYLNSFPVFQNTVLITGSKGKGSVAHMIATVMEQFLNQVGLFISPHIVQFRERICINHEMIPQELFIHYSQKTIEQFQNIQNHIQKNEYISPMGIEAAIALQYFRDYKTQCNIFECGKGVAYDDINNIQHAYAVINTVFLEHTRELGKTLQEIARNKAAIIKPGMNCVYIGKQNPDVLPIFLQRASECGVRVKYEGNDFSSQLKDTDLCGIDFQVRTTKEIYQNIHLSMFGEYQIHNAALAIAVCEDMLEAFGIIGSQNSFQTKFKRAFLELSIPGRMEIYKKKPLTIMDACINKVSAIAVRDVINYFPKCQKKIAVIAIPIDKDFEGVCYTLKDQIDLFILTNTSNPHYRFSENQRETVAHFHTNIVYIDGSENALNYAWALNPDVVFVLGTTSLITEMEQRKKNTKKEQN